MRTQTITFAIENRIYLIRKQKVLLDKDVATLYGVSTKRLNQQAQRNRGRFPEDFMFQLTAEECQRLRLQSATSKMKRGGRRFRPYVFSEHGAVMLAAVLRTPVAVEASICIARAFVKLRRLLANHQELAEKLDQLEKRVGGHDVQIRSIFQAIRHLMSSPGKKPLIGFRV